MGRLTNAVISAARSTYYALTERPKLWLLRDVYDKDYEAFKDLHPLISVYVPTHNRADLLIDRALKSICAQTYKNLEIIVAAHGCTDDTVKRVKALGDSRIKVIEIPRKRTYPPTIENHWFAGPVAAANVALEHCSGEWIARNDDDDIWTEDHIERLLRFAQAGNYEFVSARHEIRGDGQPDGGASSWWFSSTPYIVGGHMIGGTQTWLYRAYLRSFKYNADCWRKRWNKVNDTDLQQRFVNAGVRIGYLNRIVTHVLPRPGESSVGLRAYIENADKKLSQFAF